VVLAQYQAIKLILPHTQILCFKPILKAAMSFPEYSIICVLHIASLK
jgi:hypothetical protein